MSIRTNPTKLSNGVTSLMYVGDTDDAIDGRKKAVGVGALGLALILWGRGPVRLAGAAAAGYAWWKTR